MLLIAYRVSFLFALIRLLRTDLLSIMPYAIRLRVLQCQAVCLLSVLGLFLGYTQSESDVFSDTRSAKIANR